MPLSANLFLLESLILTWAKQATNQNNIAAEKGIQKSKFWHPIVPSPKCPVPKLPAPKWRHPVSVAQTAVNSTREIVINFIGNKIYTYFWFKFQRQNEFTSLKFQRWNWNKYKGKNKFICIFILCVEKIVCKYIYI